MNLITLDFESFWSSDYSLTKLSPLEYVMDDRWQTISCSIKVDHHSTDVFFGHDEIAKVFHSLRKLIEGGMVIAHNNTGFDAYVLAYRYGIRPRMWGCTMAMARPLHEKTVGLGLAKLVAHYAEELKAMGISPVKDNTILVQTRGKRLEDFTTAELAAMERYNRDDTDQCYGLFKIMRKHYTPAELWQIDAITRMRTEPAFEVDAPLLETAASVERTRKHKALLDLARTLRDVPVTEGADDEMEELDWSDEAATSEFVRSELASAPKFAALLERLGAEVPMKPSPTNPDKLIPALSKTDKGMEDLQEHEDPVVAAAARVRLDVKSTQLETRIQRFLTLGRVNNGMLPVSLKYCGAHTGRDSGEEGTNQQNMPRIGDEPKTSDALRRSHKAPKGKLVIVADQSGIELRTSHFLWKVPSSMKLYRESPDKADLYKDFAARYLYKVDPSEIGKSQRQVGKVSQLQLQFGSGASTFQKTAWTQGRVRLPLNGQERKGSEITCEDIVRSYRQEAYVEIAEGWKTCGRALQWIAQEKEEAVDPWGLVHTSAHGFVLPSGRLIRYPDLRVEDDGEWPDGRPRKAWFYAHGRHKARITGPKADENIVQALARDSIFDCSIEYFRRTGLRPALRVHDELVYVVEEALAHDLLAELQVVMRTPPKWWPELVVWSEGDAAPNYGAAK